MSTTETLTIIKHLHSGRDPEWVAAATGKTQAQVETIGDEWGWPDKARLSFAVDELTRQARQEARATIPAGATTPATSFKPHARQQQSVSGLRPATSPLRPPQPSPAVAGQQPAAQDSLAALLARADKLAQEPGTTRVAKAAQRARDAVKALAAALEDVEEAKKQAAAAAAEKAKARAEVERLQRELDAARAKLRGPKPAKRTTAKKSPSTKASAAAPPAQPIAARQDDVLTRHGVTTKDVRAWCAENDVDCPKAGRFLPRAVLDAFDEGHTPQAVAS
ncbi:hypothetical protein [Thalassiella azotivora]